MDKWKRVAVRDDVYEMIKQQKGDRSVSDFLREILGKSEELFKRLEAVENKVEDFLN